MPDYHELAASLAIAINANEPEGALATFRQLAEARGRAPLSSADRWRALAEALKGAEAAIEAHNAPKPRQGEQEAAQEAQPAPVSD